MSVALVFPGQASQSVGMMGSLAARFAQVRECFDQASHALGFNLWQLVAQGPAERLNSTEFTQPAMLVAGIATWRVWRDQGGALPTLVSGHSLGEFTALACAESIEFETAVRLVQYRGQIMQHAVPEGTGAMAVILGLEDEQVEAVCAQAAQGEIVQPVNYNSPAQVAIAGQATAVERAMNLARERGAKRALLLSVSVPAHSSLLSGAARQLEQRLKEIEIRQPRFRYLSAMDCAEHSEPADIRATLVRQLASPVRWTSAVRALLAAAPVLIECGPGKVLTGLNRRIERTAGCYALEDPDSLSAAMVAAAGSSGCKGGTHAV
jgi:[acyl-carrier-protein] S-malonyltransferase